MQQPTSSLPWTCQRHVMRTDITIQSVTFGGGYFVLVLEYFKSIISLKEVLNAIVKCIG